MKDRSFDGVISLDTLKMLPSTALASISDHFTAVAQDAAAELSSAKARVDRLLGYVEVATTEGGIVVTKLKNFAAGAAKYGAFAAAAYSAVNTAKTLLDGGQDPYEPGSLPDDTIADAETLDTASAEISTELPKPNPAQSAITQLELDAASNKITAAQNALAEALQQRDQVNSVLAKRASGELPEPKVNVSKLAEAVENIINGLTGYSEEDKNVIRQAIENAAAVNLDNFEKYVQDRLAIPYARNKAALNIIKAQLRGEEEEVEPDAIFDTVYGPPISQSGRFILSEDGIDYDSRTGSIPYITAQKIDARSWELRYAANRGGKGQLYSSGRINRFADTILSDDYKNETGDVHLFYEHDDVLQNMVSDRDLQIQDVSAKIQTLIDEGYAASSAIIRNYEESYAAVAHTYDRKIKKRKKQLQIAALFGPFGITKEDALVGPHKFYREEICTANQCARFFMGFWKIR